MNEVKFPGLNIELEVSDVIFSINNIEIHWYAVLIIVPIIICMIAMIKHCKEANLKYEYMLELFVITIPVAFISARIYYVLFAWDAYKNNLMEIFNIRNGGLAIYGGIIGALVVLLIYSKVRKIKFLDICDMIVPYLALGQSIGRWGNFFNIEAYGSETTNILRMGIIENGIYKEVHPTFLYESIGTMCIFIGLSIYRKNKKYSGQLTVIYLLCYTILRAIIEGLRTDSLMLGNFRVSQILSITVFIIILSIVLIKKYKRLKNIKD